MVVDASYYARLLEDLYDGLESLDVTGYQGADSDGWSQARTLDVEGTAVQHLECLFRLGANVTRQGRGLFIHDAAGLFIHRWVSDDDSISQARLHAAARHLMAYLDGWSLPSGERAVPQGYEVERVAEDWIGVAVNFQLLIPRT